MAWTNTNKFGQGTHFWLLADTDGNLMVHVAKESGHSIIQLTADGYIKASAGVLYGLVIGATSISAGDFIRVKDGGASGTEVLHIVFTAAYVGMSLVLPAPVTFGTDIYLDVELTGGSIWVSGIYD
jgi:hypothetical protein